MKDKYKKYIEYIARDIELPYLKSLDAYGLKQDEMDLVLGIVFNQPVHYIEPMSGVYNKDKVSIYSETSNGFWIKYDYDEDGNQIYYENSSGDWNKWEYDANGNTIYCEYSDGFWNKWEYDTNNKLIYSEDTNGIIRDNR